MKIPAGQIKELRSRTGASILECREALSACEGNIDGAEEKLAELQAKAENSREDREILEGKVFTAQSSVGIAGVVLNCETDFAADNERFLQAGTACAGTALEAQGDLETIRKETEPIISTLVAVIKENIQLTHCTYIPIHGDEKLMLYNHGNSRIIAGFTYTLEGDAAKAAELLQDTALQITASEPLFVSRNEIPHAYLSEKRAEFIEEFNESGKPEGLKEVIVKGKMEKHLKQVCLDEQTFIKDQEITVSAYSASVMEKGAFTLEIKNILRLAVR